MALVFRHPAMLMFGLMGPLLALSRWWGEKRDRERVVREHEDSERQQEHQRLLEHTRKTDTWRDQQRHSIPAVTDWLHNPLWRPEENTPDVAVRLGLGLVTPPPALGIREPVSGVPVTIPLHTSLAVVGSGLEAVAAWRAAACQALAIVFASGTPATAQVSVAGVWTKNADVPKNIEIPHPSGEYSHRWSFVDSATQVPPQATWVLLVAGNGMARLFHRGVATHDELAPDAVTFAQSRWVRARLVEADGQRIAPSPDIQASDRGALWLELSPDHRAIDLVAQGPHTLVWGKTGSGKSVLLQRLVSSLCVRYSPDQFALVGIDFKGGATLAPLTARPHSAGLLTDLTPARTARVTASLRAEIVRREQLFADYRVACWQDLPGDVTCPRVLIVVDEAGVVAHDAPELMGVLSDIASRGRSLGLHLVVSTQRPQHLPRNIIANCALRLCLGVTDADEASHYAPDIPRHLLAALRHSPPGTVAIPGRDGTYALETVDTSLPDVAWAGYNQRPLWCEELPEKVTVQELAQAEKFPAGGYLVGLADYPERQTQKPWLYHPGTHGPLVLVGESGSGHTSSLSHLAKAKENGTLQVVWGSRVPSVLAWQLMARRDASHHSTPELFLVDRVDRILQGVSPEGQAWILDAVETCAVQLSERGDGSGAVVTTAPGNSVSGALARWNATTCLFRHRDATSWAVAGGAPSLHDCAAPPGRAVVNGVALQWCHPGDTPLPPAPDIQLAKPPDGALHITAMHREGLGGASLSPSDAESRWQEIKHATTQGPGVVWSDIPPQQMRQWCAPGHTTPPVVASWPYGWHLHPGGVRLVAYEVTDP
jgi:S-DNA-T family DNA segregation ATPase FtsK/SpoIIIE